MSRAMDDDSNSISGDEEMPEILICSSPNIEMRVEYSTSDSVVTVDNQGACVTSQGIAGEHSSSSKSSTKEDQRMDDYFGALELSESGTISTHSSLSKDSQSSTAPGSPEQMSTCNLSVAKVFISVSPTKRPHDGDHMASKPQRKKSNSSPEPNRESESSSPRKMPRYNIQLPEQAKSVTLATPSGILVETVKDSREFSTSSKDVTETSPFKVPIGPAPRRKLSPKSSGGQGRSRSTSPKSPGGQGRSLSKSPKSPGGQGRSRSKRPNSQGGQVRSRRRSQKAIQIETRSPPPDNRLMMPLTVGYLMDRMVVKEYFKPGPTVPFSLTNKTKGLSNQQKGLSNQPSPSGSCTDHSSHPNIVFLEHQPRLESRNPLIAGDVSLDCSAQNLARDSDSVVTAPAELSKPQDSLEGTSRDASHPNIVFLEHQPRLESRNPLIAGDISLDSSAQNLARDSDSVAIAPAELPKPKDSLESTSRSYTDEGSHSEKASD